MRLNRINIHNFRMYKDVEINLETQGEGDIQIFVGKNGAGKTTFLNALNWCLYNEEPHAYSEEDSVPLLNFDARDSGKDEEVFVELEVVAEDNTQIIYRRTQTYKNDKVTMNWLEALEKSSTGETKTYHGEDADLKVDDFVPKAIRDSFFFDGEQLDNYFLTDRAKKIKREIFILSHIDILERMGKHLNIKYKDFNKKAGDLNPNIEGINSKLLSKQTALEKEEERELNLINQINKAKEEIGTLNELLSGVPNISSLEEKRDKLKKKEENLMLMKDEKKIEINKYSVTSSPLIFLYDALKFTLDEVNKKDENEELPPKIDQEEIIKSLNENVCSVCGRQLDDSARENMTGKLDKYQYSNAESKLLLKLKGHLSNNIEKVCDFENERNSKIKDYKFYKKSLDDVAQELIENEKLYVGYDNKEIKKQYERRAKLESYLSDNSVNLGNAEVNIKNLKNDIKLIQKELDKSMEDDKTTLDLNKKKSICYDSLQVVNQTKNEIMNQTKDEIEFFTKETFFDLLWKKETYSDVIINDSYVLKLIHSKTNNNALGSASAAERELLALAFTLGIHSISGFNSPLLIDTPLARVSDDHRVNFSNILLNISKKKQIVLIFTPDEFSDNIKPIFDNVSQYDIEVTDSEYTSIIKKVN